MGPGRRIPRPPATRPSRPEPPPDAGDTSPEIVKAAGELLALAGQIRECEICGASGSFVLGTGSPRAAVMLVKAYPSPADLESGGAFADEADALTKAFDALGIPMAWTYGTTAVRIGRESGSNEAIAHGAGHLLVEIEAVGPRIVVAFGPESSAALSRLNGRCGIETPDPLPRAELVRVRADLQVLVTEPLPEGVTNKEAKRRLWRDLQVVPGALDP